MRLILNNPYRIVGLLVGATAKEQEKQIRRLKQFIQADQEPPEDFSFPTLGELNRTMESLTEAASKLNLNSDKMNAALFWFYNGNAITDEAAFEAIKDGNTDTAIEIWRKLVYDTEDESFNEVTKRNASAFNNLSTVYLQEYGIDEETLQLKLLFLESDFFYELKKIATDTTYIISKKEIQLLFLNSLTHQEGFDTSEFIESILDIEFSAKDDFMKGFVQKPIEQLERLLNECKEHRKSKKQEVIIVGTNLYNKAKPILIQLKGILGTSNLKYTSISDKISDEVLQCGIQLFNDYKDHKTYDPGEPAMKLFAQAKLLALGSIAKQRCQENTGNLQEWIDDKPKREKEKLILTDLNLLIQIFEEFDTKPETIANAILFINKCKPRLLNIKSALGTTDELYLKLSTRVASQSQSNIIEEINKTQDFVINKVKALYSQDTKRVYFDILKNKLIEAWDATIIIGSLDMEHDFKSKRYIVNKESLRGLCSQLHVNTSGYINTSSSGSYVAPRLTSSVSSSTNEEIPEWIKWVAGIIILIILFKACN